MYGSQFIQDLIRTIPESGLAKVLSVYLKSELSKFPPEPLNDDNDEDATADNEGEAVAVLSDDILGDMMVSHVKYFLIIGRLQFEYRMHYQWPYSSFILCLPQ